MWIGKDRIFIFEIIHSKIYFEYRNFILPFFNSAKYWDDNKRMSNFPMFFFRLKNND